MNKEEKDFWEIMRKWYTTNLEDVKVYQLVKAHFKPKDCVWETVGGFQQTGCGKEVYDIGAGHYKGCPYCLGKIVECTCDFPNFKDPADHSDKCPVFTKVYPEPKESK